MSMQRPAKRFWPNMYLSCLCTPWPLTYICNFYAKWIKCCHSYWVCGNMHVCNAICFQRVATHCEHFVSRTNTVMSRIHENSQCVMIYLSIISCSFESGQKYFATRCEHLIRRAIMALHTHAHTHARTGWM
jgi:hypothetical protein